MMKRLNAFLFGLFLVCHCGHAQGIIHGVVLDRSNKPLAGANVLLLHPADSSLAKGMVTNNLGVYSFGNVKPGPYILSFSAAGHEKIYSPALTVSDKERKDLGTRVLVQASQQMADVTVTAKKPLFEQKIDRMIVNVQGNITATGSTILDVLERSPGVVVDRQNNSITLSGKNGVVVMINGKINRMPISAVIQMLEGMPASNVEKLELITTPPANLDAEGNAGYINIVLKVNDQYGTNGSFSLTAGYGNREMPQASININHRKGRLNLYGDYSYSRRHAQQDWLFSHQVSNEGKITETETNTYRNTVQRNHNIRLGMDYQASKKTVIGILLSGYDNKWTMDADNRSSIGILNRKDTSLIISNTEENRWINYGINLNLQHTISEKEKFSFNVDYLYYKDDNPVRYLNKYYDGQENFIFEQQVKSSKLTPIRFLVNAADYSRRLGVKVNLDAGLKSTISSFNNDVQIERLEHNGWERDPGLSAKYKLKEDIEAAYVSIDMTADQKTTLKAGLRYEYTNSNLGSDSLKNIVDRHYGNLFPSFYVTRKLSDNHSLGFAYSRRITRPTFRDMAPFVIFVDPNTFFSGNPALQPSLSDILKVDYTYKKYILSFSYTYTKSPIANFSPNIDSVTNVETLSATNLQNSKIATVVLSLPLTLNSWWTSSFSATGVWSQTSAIYNGRPLQIIQRNLNINMAQTFRLPKDFTFEVSGFYQSPSLFGIYSTAAFGSLDVGLQKKLGKSNFRLAYSNMLNTMKFLLKVDRPDLNLVVYRELQFVFPAVRLTYSRSFGNDKLKGTRQRSTGSEDERGRVN
ncbi:MAG TPA: outer membrane beta-barrel protein [Puia sp.]|jgi:outer membrane receptor protein involved in Fe transport